MLRGTGAGEGPRQAVQILLLRNLAERLREWGVDAEATRQAVRGAVRSHPDLWHKKAAEGAIRSVAA